MEALIGILTIALALVLATVLARLGQKMDHGHTPHIHGVWRHL